jgi:hypothetical protein
MRQRQCTETRWRTRADAAISFGGRGAPDWFPAECGLIAVQASWPSRRVALIITLVEPTIRNPIAP